MSRIALLSLSSFTSFAVACGCNISPCNHYLFIIYSGISFSLMQFLCIRRFPFKCYCAKYITFQNHLQISAFHVPSGRGNNRAGDRVEQVHSKTIFIGGHNLKPVGGKRLRVLCIKNSKSRAPRRHKILKNVVNSTPKPENVIKFDKML